MLQVGINGYGTIGKRVADAVGAQPDMAVAGVAKTRPNYEAEGAVRRKIPLYAAGSGVAFDGAPFEPAGTVEDLVAASDVVVDATPAGVGAEYRSLYEAEGTPAVFQGGESADVAPVSFNSRANFDDAVGADAARVVSCNTTGLSRVLAPLHETFGVEKARATLVRRGGDPGQTDRGPIDDILPDPVAVPSHHGPDVRTVLPDVEVETMGVTVPATVMHLHALNVTLPEAPDADAVRELLADERRIALVPGEAGIDGGGALRDWALDAGRPRGDVWENCAWADSVAVRGRDCYLFQAIHQQADVVPENVDAVRALAGSADAETSRARTDDHLGVGLSFGDDRPRVPA